MTVPAANRRSGGKLVQLIARRLILVAVLFVFLDVLIVLALYMHDSATLAEEMISLEADRIGATVHGEAGALRVGHVPAASAVRGFAVFDAKGNRVHLDNPVALPLPTRIDSLQLEASTQREHRGAAFLVSGTRRREHHGQQYWIAVAIQGQGWRPLLPALLNELVEHVALPLVPLSLLLLLFNLAAVRRMLVPLQRAVDEVNRLDPAQIEKRLQLPDSPYEVRSLLGAINRALDRMEEAIRSLRQFTSDAAHELRTPLSVMTLSIGQLPPGDARRKLQDDVASMTRMVNQMLDLARADAMLDTAPQCVDLSALTRTVVARMLPLAIDNGRSISFASDGMPLLMGQSDLLDRALTNTIQNALEHTPEGSEVEIRVGPGVRVDVRDHGTGIDMAVRASVFRRFWRQDRNRSHGAGLGLAIAQGIVRAHGGRIDIADASGGGALVSLVFGEG